VVTTPARVATELLGSSVPTAAAVVSKLRYNRLAMAHLEAETDLQGTGFKVSLQDRQLALGGVTFNHSLFGRENLRRTLVEAGMRNSWSETTKDWRNSQ
jgi:hypothetical protein